MIDDDALRSVDAFSSDAEGDERDGNSIVEADFIEGEDTFKYSMISPLNQDSHERTMGDRCKSIGSAMKQPNLDCRSILSKRSGESRVSRTDLKLLE